MDRIIEVKVNGNYLFKDNKNAGVQYEANVTSLRIEFDAGWDGYAKKVTFWDAVGGNPVERTLTTDLLEDITRSTRIYLCPIPGEPLLIAGNMTFVIDGYVDGKRQRSISDKLRVKEAPFKETAGEPADPTPTQAEQLQAEIDRIQSTIQNAAQSAENARASAEAAKNSEIVAESAKDAAETALVKAKEAQAAVETAKTEADAAIATVESAKNAAVAAADNAKASETAAKGSEEAAKASETAAESAKTAAEAAKADAEAAKTAAEKAEANAGLWAYASADNGQLTNEARAAAQAAQAAAEAAQAGAERARDQAEAVVGGDFATKTELAAHTGDSVIHVTAEEKAGWNESDVFVATYGTTTSAEIEAAYQAGKAVFVIGSNGSQMGVLLSRWSETIHYFVYLKNKTYLRLWVCENDAWSEPITTVKATPESHASTHASGGTDPITPASIGAKAATDSDVFVATYGTTTLDELNAERSAGKHIVCKGINGENAALIAADTADFDEPASFFNFASFTPFCDGSMIYSCKTDGWSYTAVDFVPYAHAANHASGGIDPITPESIGAATANHTHSEYAPAYTYGTEDLTAGTSELATGKLYFVFE